ncbi:type II secretion system F family protein [Zobellella iuensis]|uniref:Type II secretion system F family protein n=1 Tax=Zobellella iuensis TaxID=2803811 RepID=A0ABS1QP15_9GAMM|nr:type II secretion system F family protein [Zobellella iuensis]MBL1376602.1 type II secretion system F family protein [Zobellella iuensis]
MEIPLLLGLLALVLLLLSFVMFRKARLKANAESVAERLMAGRRGEQTSLGMLDKSLLKADLQLSGISLMVLGFLFIGCILLLYVGWGAGMALGGGGGLLLLGRGYMAWRFRRRVVKMVAQLPAMLDHMIRSLKSGRTLGEALSLAAAATPDPLRHALGRSQRFIERGGSLEEAMEDFAEFYAQSEFRLLALAIRVNQKYGGNATEVLGNLISLIQERDKASRQLKAMTGETRVSALVLGGLPVTLAAYIFISSPDFLMGLWQDPSGKLILLTAFAFQVFGSLALWRMLRSI